MGASNAYRQAADLAAYWRDHPRAVDYTDEELVADGARRRIRRIGHRFCGNGKWIQTVLARVKGHDPARRIACAAMAIADRHCMATPRCSGCPMIDWDCQHAATVDLRKVRTHETPSPQVYSLAREGLGAPSVAAFLGVTVAQVRRWCTMTPAPAEVERLAAMRIEELRFVADEREMGREVLLWDDDGAPTTATAYAWTTKTAMAQKAIGHE